MHQTENLNFDLANFLCNLDPPVGPQGVFYYYTAQSLSLVLFLDLEPVDPYQSDLRVCQHEAHHHLDRRIFCQILSFIARKNLYPLCWSKFTLNGNIISNENSS